MSAPDRMAEADVLRVQLAEARVQNATLALQLARAHHAAVVSALAQQYAITPADQVNADDGTITRADHPPAAARPSTGS